MVFVNGLKQLRRPVDGDGGAVEVRHLHGRQIHDGVGLAVARLNAFQPNLVHAQVLRNMYKHVRENSLSPSIEITVVATV